MCRSGDLINSYSLLQQDVAETAEDCQSTCISISACTALLTMLALSAKSSTDTMDPK